MIPASEYVHRLDSVDFPAAPEVVVRLIRQLEHPDSTAEELAAVIKLDAGLVARLLRLANSVYYRGQGVKNIDEAVVRIGIQGVRNMAFALSLVRQFRPLQFKYHQFWQHSLAVAQTVQTLEQRCATPIPEAYPAGLLHDIGMLVFDRTLGVGYAELLSKARAQSRPLHELEREVLGTDHAEVGGRLLEMWRVPEVLAESVLRHHSTDGSKSMGAKLVMLSDFVCNQQGVNHTHPFKAAAPANSEWESLGLAATEAEAIGRMLPNSLAQADALLSTTV
jgi:HD-like signal output (HDOD) protein